jgi:hypothetical protein
MTVEALIVLVSLTVILSLVVVILFVVWLIMDTIRWFIRRKDLKRNRKKRGYTV